MDEAIRKVVQADIEAQEKINEISRLRDEGRLKLIADKEDIYQTFWREAKKSVIIAKKQLEEQLEINKAEAIADHDVTLAELEKKFESNREQWRKEIYLRCLGKK
ncbi:MAG: hypothetical protein KMY54_07240 [Erysipelothrix sp.]|nr:hypothetical protein [Erysipelothrix sp.]